MRAEVRAGRPRRRPIISERLREAKGRARARGLRAAGRVHLGYRADPNTRQLVVDEDQAALVRALFERCAAGESGAAIAAWANAAGHRTKVHGGKGGAAWTGRSVPDWDRELGLTKLVLDDITVDAFIDDDPVLAETLPARTARAPTG